MPRLLLIDAKWEGEVKLTNKLVSFLKKEKPKSITLFASVQFSDLANFIKEIEKLKIKVNVTKAKRTDKPLQILGCDCYPDSFPAIKSDMVLYVGDGMFHPKALLLAISKERQVVVFDPIGNKIEKLNKNLIKNQLKKYERNLKLYMNSNSIGILVTIKPGQQYLMAAKKLKEKLEKENKKAYIFIQDNLNIFQLENYPFIKAWVNTACPRIGTDDITNINQPMINLREAMNPVRALEKSQNEK